jgi:hypothetical protein
MTAPSELFDCLIFTTHPWWIGLLGSPSCRQIRFDSIDGDQCGNLRSPATAGIILRPLVAQQHIPLDPNDFNGLRAVDKRKKTLN